MRGCLVNWQGWTWLEVLLQSVCVVGTAIAWIWCLIQLFWWVITRVLIICTRLVKQSEESYFSTVFSTISHFGWLPHFSRYLLFSHFLCITWSASFSHFTEWTFSFSAVHRRSLLLVACYCMLVLTTWCSILTAILLSLFFIGHPTSIGFLLLIWVHLSMHALLLHSHIAWVSVSLPMLALFKVTFILSLIVNSRHLAFDWFIGPASARKLYSFTLRKLVNMLWNSFPTVLFDLITAFTRVSRWSKLSVVIGCFLTSTFLL